MTKPQDDSQNGIGLLHQLVDYLASYEFIDLQRVFLRLDLAEGILVEEGIQDALYLSPCMLFQTDEIDGMLQSMSKSREGTVKTQRSWKSSSVLTTAKWWKDLMTGHGNLQSWHPVPTEI
ncbi:hypothetical protein VN12_22850 [Pirellula sp. SH-Sr6A]|uniref:hypothetical protein n=1 Tax=Pirellula sp. SH-Sr6A TaxID=1632865 RepID=UPI00078D0FA4|nr:hypothetical protein [Pirellula sp. SH-Sr6A]AMV34984.1 hypothetical protein VN12_22850 [Pirellula sp. SH-Sr6A]